MPTVWELPARQQHVGYPGMITPRTTRISLPPGCGCTLPVNCLREALIATKPRGKQHNSKLFIESLSSVFILSEHEVSCDTEPWTGPSQVAQGLGSYCELWQRIHKLSGGASINAVYVIMHEADFWKVQSRVYVSIV